MDVRPVVGAPGYFVGADGSVWSAKSGSMLPLRTHDSSGWGHQQVSLCVNGANTHRLVSRMVLEAYVGACPDGCEACHNDGNPLNNHLDNLRWDTHKSNMRDRAAHGRWRPARGEEKPQSKLTEADVIEILISLAYGESRAVLAKRYGVSTAAIAKIYACKSWAGSVLHATG